MFKSLRYNLGHALGAFAAGYEEGYYASLPGQEPVYFKLPIRRSEDGPYRQGYCDGFHYIMDKNHYLKKDKG